MKHMLRVVTAVAMVAGLMMGVLVPAAGAEDAAKDGGPATEEPTVDIPPFVTVIGDFGKWTKFEAPLGRVYGNFGSEDGFVAIIGGDLTDVCDPEGVPPIITGIYRQMKDGTWTVRTLPGGAWTSVSIYETDLDAFAFFDQQCPLFGAGDPALAQPFAVGTVVLRDKSWNQPEPFPMEQQGRYRNSIRGWAVADDGTTYKIRALADYEVTTDGEFIPFRGYLKVRPIG